MITATEQTFVLDITSLPLYWPRGTF